MKLRQFLSVFIAAFIMAYALLNIQLVNTHVGFVISKIWPGPEINTAYAAEYPIPTSELPIVGSYQYTESEQSLPDRAMLVIEKLRINVPIVFGIDNDLDAIYDNLHNGVVNHPVTVRPGENGVSILLGHSSAYPWDNNPYGTIFALLGKLSVGDRFRIEYSNGQTFNYVMKESLIFNPFDPNDQRLQEFEKLDRNGVALVTCWPPGGTLKRLAVRADQV